MAGKPYILGISGGSGSGKTFLQEQLMDFLPDEHVTLVSQDHYYLKYENQKKDAEGLVNFDHPESVNLDRLAVDLKRLIAGESFEIEEYTFNNANKIPKIIPLSPKPIIIVEGLFIFYHDELASLMDLKLFVEADEHIKLARRIRRDDEERGYKPQSVLRDYERFVAPMYHQYVAPGKRKADLIIPNNFHMHKAIEVLVKYFEGVLGKLSHDKGDSIFQWLDDLFNIHWFEIRIQCFAE